MSAEEKRMTLKLVVDTEKKRVIFAEADKDFVDILFSFLTLPLGTIIRLLGKQSTLGSLSNLYESIEALDPRHLQTEACKAMLLRPQSAAALLCEDLKLNVDDDAQPRVMFCCSKPDCCAKPIRLASAVANARCPHCQQLMSRRVMTNEKNSVSKADGDGVFVKGGVSFVITDDLQVIPASSAHSLGLLQNLRIQEVKEINMNLGTKEILNLLKASLVSKAALTAICFNEMEIVDGESKGDIFMTDSLEIGDEDVDMVSDETNNRKIKLKLYVVDGKVLCAEAAGDFADAVLSFLTFPLGSVIKFLNTSFPMGCVANLYRSVQGLCLDYMKSNECRDMLLSPKLASFFGCDSQLLEIKEVTPQKGNAALTRLWGGAKCNRGLMKNPDFIQLNPKSRNGNSEVGGGYAGRREFITTDDLHFSRFSFACMEKMVPIEIIPIVLSTAVRVEIEMDHIDVLNLLRAALISETPLSDVFLRNKKKRKRMCS